MNCHVSVRHDHTLLTHGRKASPVHNSDDTRRANDPHRAEDFSPPIRRILQVWRCMHTHRHTLTLTSDIAGPFSNLTSLHACARRARHATSAAFPRTVRTVSMQERSEPRARKLGRPPLHPNSYLWLLNSRRAGDARRCGKYRACLVFFLPTDRRVDSREEKINQHINHTHGARR